jgi:hypothetical protein
VGGGALPELGGDPIGDFLGVSDEEITQMWGELGKAAGDAFQDIAGDDLARARQNLATLRGELGRIRGSKPFQTLQDAVNAVFGTGEGSLWSQIKRFGDDVQTFFSATLPGYFDGLPGTLQQKLVTPFTAAVKDVFDALMGSGRGVTLTLKAAVEQVPVSVVTWLSGLGERLAENLVTPFSERVRETWGYLTDAANPDSLAAQVSAIPGAVAGWLTGLGERVREALVQPFYDQAAAVWDRLLGDGPDSLKTTLTSLPGQMAGWLKDLPGKLKEALLGPFEEVVNDILAKLDFLPDWVKDRLGIGGDSGGGQPAQPFEGPRGFGARGGRVRPGELWVVGERGWEFFRPDVPGTIIPHSQSVRLLNRLQPLPTVTPARAVTNVSNTTSTVLTVNFHGGNDRQNLRMKLSEARALL